MEGGGSAASIASVSVTLTVTVSASAAAPVRVSTKVAAVPSGTGLVPPAMDTSAASSLGAIVTVAAPTVVPSCADRHRHRLGASLRRLSSTAVSVAVTEAVPAPSVSDSDDTV